MSWLNRSLRQAEDLLAKVDAVAASHLSAPRTKTLEENDFDVDEASSETSEVLTLGDRDNGVGQSRFWRENPALGKAVRVGEAAFHDIRVDDYKMDDRKGIGISDGSSLLQNATLLEGREESKLGKNLSVAFVRNSFESISQIATGTTRYRRTTKSSPGRSRNLLL